MLLFFYRSALWAGAPRRTLCAWEPCWVRNAYPSGWRTVFSQWLSGYWSLPADSWWAFLHGSYSLMNRHICPDANFSLRFAIIWHMGSNTLIDFECSYMRSLHYICKWNLLYVPGSLTAAHSRNEWIRHTALYRADAISLTKHFEGREAPDKAPDKAPGPPFNWQMGLIVVTGLKWARVLTFQRTEPSGAETPVSHEQTLPAGSMERSLLTASTSPPLCFPEIRTTH